MKQYKAKIGETVWAISKVLTSNRCFWQRNKSRFHKLIAADTKAIIVECKVDRMFQYGYHLISFEKIIGYGWSFDIKHSKEPTTRWVDLQENMLCPEDKIYKNKKVAQGAADKINKNKKKKKSK